MRISKLSERACLPVGTVKFYLRSGLLHPGQATSATQALYDESHLDRLRMIRALFEVGGLALADIQRVLDAIDLPTESVDVSLALVDEALTGAPPEQGGVDVTAARNLLLELGWHVDVASPHLVPLARALSALADVGVVADRERLKSYAEAAAHVARHDVTAMEKVPENDRPRTLAASQVLFEPVFSSLRRLAREHQALATRSRIPSPRISVPNA
ncbi:DNA-binding transcriptional MerR regulator [Nocardioides daedukensis]|uniref:DNA-binding transcriptional MerR regulator n=1 Tax=Nocardioides daedukensis TaxID=634462 RepID=A0A7Y9RZJ4_9ACTN|nr:MerR family transcriptional regulator [Nocardioides daedukensis]NYG58219.1 DNA-binding transcriptional MerR regulator [Nocardioides daedukensis]